MKNDHSAVVARFVYFVLCFVHIFLIKRNLYEFKRQLLDLKINAFNYVVL